jgi:5'-nucleotidase
VLILLTNDDGIAAPGLRALKDALAGLGDLWVVAPEGERSGVSHAFSLATPLRVEEVRSNGGVYGYSVSGTPVDSAKIALRSILPEKPGLVVSGINRGENTGVNVLYSGTVAAAMEGAIVGIPSVAVSVVWRDKTDYAAAAFYARKVCERVVAKGLPFGILLNVNVPALPLDKIKGLVVARMADSHYIEEIEKRVDPRGREYYWIAGSNHLVGDGKGTDMNAVRDGYVSVTPLDSRMTNDEVIPLLQGWNFE